MSTSDAPRWRRYLRFWGPDPDRDAEDEIRFHLEMREAELRAAGVEPGAARTATLERFGDVDGVRHAVRAIDRRHARRLHAAEWLGTIRQDLAFALRQLVRSPGFTAAAIITLALGIGANSVIFSLVDTLVLRPTPGVREPQRVISLVTGELPYPVLRDYQAAPAPVEGIAGYRSRALAVHTGGDARVEAVMLVTGNYFPLLAVRAQRGRLLGPADDAPGAPAAAVVSDRFWRGALGSDPAVLGRTIRISGAPVTIVGVATPEFRGTSLDALPAVWVPIATWPLIRPSGYETLDLDDRGWGWLAAIARLRDGATLPQLAAAMHAAAVQERALYPKMAPLVDEPKPRPIAAVFAGEQSSAAIARFMAVLTAVVATVLLIACANIANLLLARAARRRREIAVRLALGASRWRLVRQLVTEALALAVLAAATALGVTWLVLRALDAVTLPGGTALGALGLGVSGTVLAFTALVTLAAALLFGLAPALQAARDARIGGLRDATGDDALARSRLRDVLLVAQVAMSVLLLVGAGLFGRALQRALAIDPGFDPTQLATATVNAGLVRHDTTRAERYAAEALERAAALPGVRHAAWAVSLPLGNDDNALTGWAEGHRPPPGVDPPSIHVDIVSPGYFATVRTPLLQGRDFAATDRAGSVPVAIVSRAFAEQNWRGESPLGRYVVIGDTMRVIGVAADAKLERLDDTAAVPMVYLPLAQNRSWLVGSIHLAARTSGDPDAVLPALRRALRASGEEVPITGIASYGAQYAELLMPQRVGVLLLGAFGVVALAIAAVGIYGVVSYLVSQRAREIGIRLALGARPGAVIALIVRHNVSRVLLGLAIGLGVAALATRALSRFLFGVPPLDGPTYLATALVLASAGLLAAWLPARRVTRVDPVTVLRAE